MFAFFSLSKVTRHEIRTTLVLALPLIAGQLSTMSMNMIDVVLAGHLGPQVLAPVAIGTSVWMLALVSIGQVMVALPASVAHLEGAKRHAEVWPLFRQALWLGIIGGALIGGAEALLGPALIKAIGVTPDLVRDATSFLHAVAAGAPALGIFFACRGLSDGLSMTRPGFCFSLLGPILLAPISYVLMYGAWGLPGWGVVGSGAATALVLWIQALAFLAFTFFAPRYRPLKTKGMTHPLNGRAIGELLRVGTPMGITSLMEASLFIATALVIGRLGEHAVAMHQIALNVASTAFMIPLGLSMAITVRVANARGRNSPEGVRLAGYVGIGMTFCIQLCSGAFMLLFPAFIVGLYTHDPVVIAGATVLLRLAGLFQLSDGLQVAANGALRGLKDTRLPMFITLFAYWIVGMPVGVWLSIGRGMGAAGMWIGLLVGLSMAAILLLGRFVRASRVAYKRLPETRDGVGHA